MVLFLILIAVTAYVALILPVAVIVGRTLRGPASAPAAGTASSGYGEPYPAGALVPSLSR